MGRRLVLEWNLKTNRKRTWHESVTHQNKVNQVRIMKKGKKVHYRFNNRKYSHKWWEDVIWIRVVLWV